MLLIPFSKQSLLLIAVNKAPIATLNGIVIESLLTKECAAFSDVSVFGVRTENGSFFQIYAFSLAFSKSPVFTAEQCERKAKRRSFTPFSYENGAV